MICLMFPSASQLTLKQARAKLSAFEYENKESRESNNCTKRLNCSSFKEAPYRNPDISQRPLIKDVADKLISGNMRVIRLDKVSLFSFI